jgi:CBS domain-containing protein
MRHEQHISLKVADVKEKFSMVPAVVDVKTTVEDVLRNVVGCAESGCIYVEDRNGKLFGCIRPQSILNYCFPFEAMLWQNEFTGFMEVVHNESLGSIIDRDIHQVTDETEVSTVIMIMAREKIDEVPVVNDKGELTGRITLPSLVHLYLKSRQKVQ